MAITFFGVATAPADNSGSSTGPTRSITPPGSMVDGDLVFVSVRYRASTTTITNSVTGGQTWNATTQYDTTNIRARVFWCRFNGTWAADPVFTVTSGTNNIDAQMLVFRPTSAAYTWTLEAQTNDSPYSAPGSPFTVTITGRNTTADSTVSVAAWHSVDDNTWGTLSGTGWSKTSLGAQYRNNDTADNSSSFAYRIQTSAGATNNVSQNQATLGGDAGSTGLWTFAETLVTPAITGVAGTSAAGLLGSANTVVGLEGLQVTASVGTASGPSSSSNATATLTGAAATAAIGTLVLLMSSVIGPTGVGVSATASEVVLSTRAVPVGSAATGSAGTLGAIGLSAGIIPIAGVASSLSAGLLGGATTIAGIAGVEATVSAGTAVGTAGGLNEGAGQPSSTFATVQLGDVAVLVPVIIQGVSATATAESMGASLVLEDLDGGESTATPGVLSPGVTVPLSGLGATSAAGTVTVQGNVAPTLTGVSTIATVGNLAGITVGSGSVGIGGAESSGQAGAIAVQWLAVIPIEGVAATAEADDVAVEAGDSEAVEVYPSGVESEAQAGAITLGEALAAPEGVVIQMLAGTITVRTRSPGVPDVSPGKRLTPPPRNNKLSVTKPNRTFKA